MQRIDRNEGQVTKFRLLTQYIRKKYDLKSLPYSVRVRV